MTAVSALLRDLEHTLGSGTMSERAVTLSRLTDLFVVTAKGLTEEQVSVFDVVISRLASTIESRARADLSERMADVANAPHGVVRQLALDEIDIARPVLTRSPRLTEEDLVAVAAHKGRDHMLAITERPDLAVPVTDYLVLKGDRVVTHAVAANHSAKFSRRGMTLLVTRASMDEPLQSLLGDRTDVPEDLASQLMAVAKDAARRRLAGIMPKDNGAAVDGAVERASATMAASTDLNAELSRFNEALVEIHALEEAGKLLEQAVAAFAQEAKIEHVICAVSVMAKLGLPATERALFGPDRDTVLIIGKALRWGWPTLKAVLGLRAEDEQAIHLMDKARENYEALSLVTAQRVLRFLEIREQAGHPAAGG